MQKIVVGILFYISSLLPLNICILIKYWNNSNIKIISFIAIGIGCLFLVLFMIFILMKKNKGIKEQTFNAELNDINLDRRVPLDFLFAYIIPFIAFDLSKGTEVACFFIIIVVYLILYISNRTYHVNVMLYLVGYKVFNCVDNKGKSITVISKGCWKSFNNSKIYGWFISSDLTFVINHLK